MNTPRSLRSTIFRHLAELLSVENPSWEMVAMVFFVEVSLMALLQAPSDAQFSHARCCSGSWGSRWALAGTMEEPGEQPVRCGARGLSAVPAASIQAWPCPGVLALPELMAGASAAPLQLPLRVFQMVGCIGLSEELDCALAIFPTYLQSQCLGMPTLVLRAILRLTERPDTVSRGQLGQPGQQPMAELWVVGNVAAWAFVGMGS